MAIFKPLHSFSKNKSSISDPLNTSWAKFGLLALLSISQMSVAASIKPIHFQQGAVTSKVEGVLQTKQNDTWYQFKAQKGQYAVINIMAKSNTTEIANVGVLHMPSGKEEGSKGGIVYQGCLPETGNYKLRIARNLMATTGGKAGYQAEVIVLPTYASQELCK